MSNYYSWHKVDASRLASHVETAQVIDKIIQIQPGNNSQSDLGYAKVVDFEDDILIVHVVVWNEIQGTWVPHNAFDTFRVPLGNAEFANADPSELPPLAPNQLDAIINSVQPNNNSSTTFTSANTSAASTSTNTSAASTSANTSAVSTTDESSERPTKRSRNDNRSEQSEQNVDNKPFFFSETEFVTELSKFNPWVGDKDIPGDINYEIAWYDLRYMGPQLFKKMVWATTKDTRTLRLYLNFPYDKPTWSLSNFPPRPEMLVFSGSNSNWLNNPDGAFAFYIRFTLLMPLQRIGIEAQVQVALELINDGSYHALSCLSDGLKAGAHFYSPLLPPPLLVAIEQQKYEFVNLLCAYSYLDVAWQVGSQFDSQFDNLQTYNGKTTLEIIYNLVEEGAEGSDVLQVYADEFQTSINTVD